MLIKRWFIISLCLTSYAAIADTELLAKYTDVESVSDAKVRLDRRDVLQSELIRTQYIVEKTLDTRIINIRPLIKH